jgi:hypothetical protein
MELGSPRPPNRDSGAVAKLPREGPSVSAEVLDRDAPAPFFRTSELAIRPHRPQSTSATQHIDPPLN